MPSPSPASSGAVAAPRRVAGFAVAAILAIAALVASLGASGCKAKAPAERLRVAASIFPIYDLVRRVAGPDADVALVLPLGRSPHGFRPDESAVAAASSARLGVMIGLGLDTWMAEAMPSAGGPPAPGKPRLLKLGDRVPTLTRRPDPARDVPAEGAEDDGSIDPYVWLDPQRARLMVKAIGEELAKLDARHAGAYRTRTSEVDAALDALDKEVEARTSAFRNHPFVTAHATFGYFAERYHLVAESVSSGVAPAATEPLVARLRAKRVAGIFREAQLDPGPSAAIAAAAGVPLGVLDLLGGGSGAESYEAMIRFDVVALAQAMP